MIVDDFIKKISEGELEAGEKLPSQRKIAIEYNVNRSTVIQSLDILGSYGVLESIEKKGLYVSNDKWNAYITNNISWQNYIGNSISKSNQYYVRKINELEFKEDIIRMGTGELPPNMIPNDLFKEIITNDANDMFTSNYEEPKGNSALRETIAEYMKRRGIDCDKEQICITSGALQGLKLIADGLLVPQSKIIVETPSYIHSVRTWNNIRAKITPFTIDYIKSNINHIFKAGSDYQNSIFYCIPTLHNPTQNTYTDIEKQKIIDQCKRNGIPIVEDDVYGDLWFEKKRPVPMKSMKNSDNVLYLGSLSKTVSPGLRIGWIVGNENVIQHLADLKMQNDYGSSSISQYIAHQWLKEPKYHEQHIRNLKKQLKHKKEIFLNSMSQYLSKYGEWEEPKGSFYIWFQFTVPINLKKLFIEAAEENLLIHPGEIYDSNETQSLRFSYSYIEEDRIDFAMKKMQSLIESAISHESG